MNVLDGILVAAMVLSVGVTAYVTLKTLVFGMAAAAAIRPDVSRVDRRNLGSDVDFGLNVSMPMWALTALLVWLVFG